MFLGLEGEKETLDYFRMHDVVIDYVRVYKEFKLYLFFDNFRVMLEKCYKRNGAVYKDLSFDDEELIKIYVVSHILDIAVSQYGLVELRDNFGFFMRYLGEGDHITSTEILSMGTMKGVGCNV